MTSGARHGFTLVEVLVSMTVGMLVLLLAVSSLRSTGDGYERSTGGVAAEREGRAVITQASEDLSKAVSGQEMEFGGPAGGGWEKGRLGFLCLQPNDAQAEDELLGDLCAVVYYIKDLEVGGETVRCLLRGFRGSTETFAAVRSGTVGDLYDEQPQDEPVAFGVVSFGVDPLRRGAGGGWEEWTAAGDLDFHGPDAVRLRLVVARRELIGKLRTSSDWETSALLGRPGEVEGSRNLEMFEIIQRFGHAS